MTRQLVESLDRLQTGHVDIYMLHRDDIEVPVGDFIEALNEHQRAGRIGIFGASNWNLSRIDAANEYARNRKLNGFSVVSNHFSLARMVETAWEGTASAADPKSREWFARSAIPLLSWSSQAGGFFVRANPADQSDKTLARCWYSEDNFQRLARARLLSSRHGVTATQIALAYVLNQPFPTFPMVGPLNLPELRSCCEATFVRLGPREVAWLNLESDTL
jgi:aryl-alcohol dehydrogenase-like predicted oxidoreductase